MTDHDPTIKRMAAAGYSDTEIASHLGKDRQWVRRRRCELGIKPGHKPMHRAIIARLHMRRLCGRVAA